jgi:hypothetical protein
MSRRSEFAQPERLNRDMHRRLSIVSQIHRRPALAAALQKSSPKGLAFSPCSHHSWSLTERHLLSASLLIPPLGRPIAALMNS